MFTASEHRLQNQKEIQHMHEYTESSERLAAETITDRSAALFNQAFYCI